MLEYEEFAEAVERGYIQGTTVMIIRREGRIVDYVLPDETVKEREIVSVERVVDILSELDENE